MAVVTAHYKGEIRGATISSFATCSLSPPMLTFNLKKPSRFLDFLRDSAGCRLNILSHLQAAESQHFADVRLNSEFQDLDCAYGLDQVPVLLRSLAVLKLRRGEFFEVGDHSAVFCFIESIEGLPFSSNLYPLLYFNRTYSSLPMQSASTPAIGLEQGQILSRAAWVSHSDYQVFLEDVWRLKNATFTPRDLVDDFIIKNSHLPIRCMDQVLEDAAEALLSRDASLDTCFTDFISSRLTNLKNTFIH